MKKFIYLFVLLLILTGCGVTHFVMADYKGKKIPSKAMGIYLKDFHVKNKKDITDDLGEGKPDEVFANYFDFKFEGSMLNYSNFSVIEFLNKTDFSELEETTLTISDKESIYVDIPTEGNVFKTDSTYFDYVLIIEDLYVSRVAGTSGSPGVFMASPGGGGSWSGGTGGTCPMLQMEYEFVIWDNGERRMVAYGKMITSAGFMFAMTDNTWETECNNVAKDILRKTPFDIFSGSYN